MESWPQTDPIPLPAPVWLFKSLSLLTTSAHLLAVTLLTGGLILALMSYRRMAGGERLFAREVITRMPVLLTFVINFGVPPLLFAQVLYGRALYTSSVLIGALWIAVIPLLILAGWLIYHAAARAKAGQSFARATTGALSLVVLIGFIYVVNMSLMLEPEQFQKLYGQSASGLQVPEGGALRLWRGLFFLAMTLPITALGAMGLANYSKVDERVRPELWQLGRRWLLIGAPLTLVCGALAFFSHSPGVRAASWFDGLLSTGLILCLAGGAIALLAGILATKPRRSVHCLAWAGGTALLVGTVFVRDGLRDLRLAARGLDVWAREVAANWSVVLLFLGLLVAGLAAMAWLVLVVLRASKEEIVNA